MESRGEVEISIIMSIYNQWNQAQLSAAIHSVLNQTFQNFEFIIYSDGSDEEVTDRLKEYAKKDARIVLIGDPKNHGLAYSLNTCIDVAKGKYLARMDDDDICVPERLQIQYDFLEEHQEIAFVGSNAKLIDDRGIWGVRKMPEKPGKQDFLRFSPFIHPSIMIRRSVFEKTDAYCAGKETWRCEDYELFMRLWRLGYTGYNIQQELLFYREDAKSYKKRKFKYRIDEMRLRYHNFKKLGMLYPVGWLYVLRPVAAAFVLPQFIFNMKKFYHGRDKKYGERIKEEVMAISGDTEKRTDVVGNI